MKGPRARAWHSFVRGRDREMERSSMQAWGHAFHFLTTFCFQFKRVTVVKDRDDRAKSKGVAFILFVRKEDAIAAVKAMNGTELHERTLKVKIATDNGRSREFIKKRVYANKSKCFECGVCPCSLFSPLLSSFLSFSSLLSS